jgi:hypothetical protein
MTSLDCLLKELKEGEMSKAEGGFWANFMPLMMLLPEWLGYPGIRAERYLFYSSWWSKAVYR